MPKVKGKIKASTTTSSNEKKRKPIKPKLGRGIGGVIMTSIRMKVEKDKKEKENKPKQNG